MVQYVKNITLCPEHWVVRKYNIQALKLPGHQLPTREIRFREVTAAIVGTKHYLPPWLHKPSQPPDN